MLYEVITNTNRVVVSSQNSKILNRKKNFNFLQQIIVFDCFQTYSSFIRAKVRISYNFV